LHFFGLKEEEEVEAICRALRQVWLSRVRIKVISSPRAEREAGPGERGGGKMRIPWAETRGMAVRMGGRKYILGV
jgi:hypothetical protein